MTNRTVWLVGATGLVGRETLEALLRDDTFTRVIAWSRRPVATEHPRLTNRVVDFERLETAFSGERADDAVCCLGTTMKIAGSRERFRRVDYDYSLAFARAALAAGAKHLVVVTALGANTDSAIFYNRVKGELEKQLATLPFESLTVARPSLLLGKRDDDRLGERLFAPLSKILPARYRGIEARALAAALVGLLDNPPKGQRIVTSGQLQALGAAMGITLATRARGAREPSDHAPI